MRLFSEKKNLTYLLLMISVTSFWGCKMESEAEPEIDEITLIRPVETIESHYDIFFEWEAGAMDTLRFQLAEDSTFEELIIDSLTSVSSFFYEDRLVPDQRYYWRVSDSLLSQESFFTIEDVMSPYVGVYDVDVLRQDWDTDAGIYHEENYETTIELVKQGINMVMLENTSDTDFLLYFSENEQDLNILRYSTLVGPYLTYFEINTVTDSIHAYTRRGGIGYGSIYFFEGKVD